jgi:hypothetical protein
MPKSSSFIIVILLAILVSACNFPASRKATPPSTSQPASFNIDAYPVDPVFQGLYDFLGGETIVGPAIAPMVESGDLKTQYLQAAQMVYDPLAPESDRFQLESLGRMFGVAEPSVPDPGLPGVRYSNGHVILDEFVPMYEKLGGARFVGRPLTEGRHNPEKNRIEQYFENLGFYRLENEESGTVHLMAYGAMACPQDCRTRPSSASIPSLKTFLPTPFSTAASRFGLDFTGLTLSSPHLGEEGDMEVIFENLVMTMDSSGGTIGIPGIVAFQLWLPNIVKKIPDTQQGEILINLWLPVIVKIIPGDRMMARIELVEPQWIPMILRGQEEGLGGLRLKPIVQMIGIEPQPPVPPNNNPLHVFYQTEGELGHNVPVLFDDFLKRFGGIPVVGNPITEVFYLENGVYRQCFTNLCLDVEFKEVPQLRPAPLGLEYKKQYYPGQGTEPKFQERDNLRLTILEEKPIIKPGENQEIVVVVTASGLPLENQMPVLTITQPDGTQQVFQMEPTDQLGSSRFIFPPIEARRSTLIPYEICLPLPEDEKLCVEDNYAVWD